MPKQNISAFDIPDDLKEGVAVFVCGSPAGHDPDNNRLSSSANNITFKQEIFYSMQWHTDSKTAVVMTYCGASCPGLVWWSLNKPTRALVVTPAHFDRYRPRRGLADSHDELGHDNGQPADTMVALYIPRWMAQTFCWAEDGKLDVSRSIRTWLGNEGRLLTFGAYTAELELDIIGCQATPRHRIRGDTSGRLKELKWRRRGLEGLKRQKMLMATRTEDAEAAMIALKAIESDEGDEDRKR